ncbi:MAG: hypothetical protein J3K34DRAFT_18868 [Monoraphidium minutum]|nr:MAG: hypothetical protein J3K34DRAFT_18868 [Monoraphidium minutum]
MSAPAPAPAAAPAPATPRAALAAAAAARGWSLRPLHRDLGVEISGADLRAPLDGDTAALLFDLICEYDLLLFRGQELTPADEERVLTTVLPHDTAALAAKRFCNGFFKTRIPDHPLVIARGHGVTLDNHYGLSTSEPLSARPPYIDPSKVFNYTRIWHQDMGDLATLPEFGSIYMITTPKRGGATLFASTRLARLPPAAGGGEDAALLRRLRAVNARCVLADGFTMDDAGVRRLDDFESKVAASRRAGAFVEQPPVPVVARDPDTGAEHLVCSAHCLYEFQGLPHAKSRALLESLLAGVTAEGRVYSHAWADGDFVIWSNRRTIHSGTSEAEYQDDVRLMHLVFLDSARPLVPADPTPDAAPPGAPERSLSLARGASMVIRRGTAAAAMAAAVAAAAGEGEEGGGGGEAGPDEAEGGEWEWDEGEASVMERVASFV